MQPGQEMTKDHTDVGMVFERIETTLEAISREISQDIDIAKWKGRLWETKTRDTKCGYRVLVSALILEGRIHVMAGLAEVNDETRRTYVENNSRKKTKTRDTKCGYRALVSALILEGR
ncbi:unnamed protein product [Anisakis simplex]|uniref:Transposase n=1 Tax=Anisakis simplex TaxID=6269 RepID=A0A0M3KB86_ANISI|nr:unnamed protein product [Anisakis simplex]